MGAKLQYGRMVKNRSILFPADPKEAITMIENPMTEARTVCENPKRRRFEIRCWGWLECNDDEAKVLKLDLENVCSGYNVKFAEVSTLFGRSVEMKSGIDLFVEHAESDLETDEE